MREKIRTVHDLPFLLFNAGIYGWVSIKHCLIEDFHFLH